MPVVQQGNVNTTALVVPDLYVQIVSPQNLVLNGVPTNIVGAVGTASWGPVGKPVHIGSMSDFSSSFGPVIARKHDLGTQIAVAVQQGAQSFRCVRVTDGTDVAAQTVLSGSTVTFTALYTGTLGNQIVAALSTGSKAGTWRLTVSMPGMQPEIFDNLGGSGAAFWTGLAAALNSGIGVNRGPSLLVHVDAGGATVTPTAFSITLGTTVAGADGADAVTATALVGTDMVPRTGMYALRGQGCAIALLADADEAPFWVTQAQFGLSEGIYMILTGPANDTISNAVSVKASAGLDSYAAKLMFGDWLWWSDQVNHQVRLVSPQGFVAGRLGNLSPEQSSLNKQIYGVVGSQKSGAPGTGQSTSYSSAELAALFSAGIDVISNPQPGGAYWGVRAGHNSSSSSAINGDNYTRLTNFIAATLSAGMGLYVGQVINSDLFGRIRATLLSFLQAMLSQGLLGSGTGTLPFSVVCDSSNNPDSRTALGYVQADVQIRYQGINEKFIVNLEGGQGVQVSQQTLPSGQPVLA